MARLICLSVVLLLFFGVETACAIPFVNPANAHTYDLTPTAMAWPDAEAYAVSRGGHLVAINDSAELTWILDTLPLPSSWVWIGGHDQGLPTWAWTTGESFTFTNWNVGEPDNVPSVLGQGFAAMWTVTTVSDDTTPFLARRGRWLDLAARDGVYFGVVEIATSPALPEPSVCVLTGLGGASLAGIRRRRGDAA